MMYINGRWVNAAGNATFPVYDPSNGQKIGEAADGNQDDVRQAIEAARQAFGPWSGLTAYQRSEYLYTAYQLMMGQKEHLARVMTEEQGKPLRASMGEVQYGADFLCWYAEEAKRIYGETIPAPRPDQRFIVMHQPVGVVAAVTPWNYPISMITRKIALALAAGCTVVLKPAEVTPLCAVEMFKIFEKANIPAGVVNLVTALNPAPVGETFTGHPLVSKITFTGSTEVGKLLAQKAATQIKRISLELGGHAPFIVFDDEETVLAMANDTHYGLASYVYTLDLSRAMRMFENLKFGIVGINDINPTAAAAPFGGMKESGLGREGGREGIAEYLETKLGGFSIR